MKRNRFIELIVEYGGAKLADQLPRSLRLVAFSALAGVAAIFALAWASVTGWIALEESAGWSSTQASLGITGIFLLIGAGFALYRYSRIRKANALLPVPRSKLKMENLNTNTLANETKTATEAVEKKTSEAVALIKRSAEGAVDWIRENPVQATLVGVGAGVVVGMIARKMFESGKEVG